MEGTTLLPLELEYYHQTAKIVAKVKWWNYTLEPTPPVSYNTEMKGWELIQIISKKQKPKWLTYQMTEELLMWMLLFVFNFIPENTRKDDFDFYEGDDFDYDFS